MTVPARGPQGRASTRPGGQMRALVTGGAGFIGSALAERLLVEEAAEVLVYDKLTYAGRRENFAPLTGHERFRFVQHDILDRGALDAAIEGHRPTTVFHLAAESHVDRSIDHAVDFVRTNVEGTLQVLEASLAYFSRLPADQRAAFRVIHVSTDEVFGALGESGSFSESTPYAPNSPYAASKAASDLLARAFHRTYGLPTVITNCSNNFGPRQFPEKLIPLCLLKALAGEALPIYGQGLQVRDWLYVHDHVDALVALAGRAGAGQQYCIGGGTEIPNIETVRRLCAVLDALRPRADGASYATQMTFVADRPGHDFRYSIDHSKIHRDIGWRPRAAFDSALRETVAWYLSNPGWIESLAVHATTASATTRRGHARARA